MWQGADGIAWLCVVDAAALQSGAFYLDRKVGPKHIAGPFFTEGTYTKNTRAEVDKMGPNPNPNPNPNLNPTPNTRRGRRDGDNPNPKPNLNPTPNTRSGRRDDAPSR